MCETLDRRLGFRAFIHNVADKVNVAGHYLTSDTSGPFRDYFLPDPRLYRTSLRRFY